MRVAIISTYPPRACGIATFSRDLLQALRDAHPSVTVGVVSIVRDQRSPPAAEVLHVIRQDVRADYTTASAAIDAWGADAVLIEHEYGIFGGECGSHVLALARQLRQPYVVTLHTVLSRPSDDQTHVVTELCRKAAAVTVFTDTARRMVVDSGVASRAQVRVVPHGAPMSLLPAGDDAGVREFPQRASAAVVDQLRDRVVLSTFGLLSAGKGVEIAIEALPAVVAQHPNVMYLVAGQTHPDVVTREGERYRLHLEKLVRDRSLDRHVHFIDRFLSEHELAELLASTDLFLTPYRSREQIVSGALTFAIAAGCPVVSTPYYYAEDLLATGAGAVVPFDDAATMADAILQFLNNPADRAKAAAEARRIGAALTWPAVAAQIIGLVDDVVGTKPAPRFDPRDAVVGSSPPVRTDHLLSLIDDTGIIQRADGVLPSRRSGYSVDDGSRPVAAIGLDRDPADRTFSQYITLGLSFLRRAWKPDAAGMHNVLSHERRWLDEPHVGDRVGRTRWALGTVIAAYPPRAVTEPSRRLMRELVGVVDGSDSLRTMAYSIIGLTRLPLVGLPTTERQLLERLATRLLDAYRPCATPDWRWFEDTRTYDNARLPQALITAGRATRNASMTTAGLKGLDWYAEQCGLHTDQVRLIGNASLCRRTHPVPSDTDGDEQPLDAAALVEAHAEALVATGHPRYEHRALRSFEWFLGCKRLKEPVYDFVTGGCHDGLNVDGLNDNEGAESTLAYSQALLAIEAADLQPPLRMP